MQTKLVLKYMAPYTIQRFLGYLKDDENSDCILFIGGVNKDGYGLFRIMEIQYLAHRVSLILNERCDYIGYEIHHLCENRRCVNTLHLKALLPIYHTKTKTFYNSIKTSCIRGHRFTEENTYVRENGKRECRSCKRITNNRYRKTLK